MIFIARFATANGQVHSDDFYPHRVLTLLHILAGSSHKNAISCQTSASSCRAIWNRPNSVHRLNRWWLTLFKGQDLVSAFRRHLETSANRLPSEQERRRSILVVRGSRKRSSIRSHWLSVSGGLGSVLTPAINDRLVMVQNRAIIDCHPFGRPNDVTYARHYLLGIGIWD